MMTHSYASETQTKSTDLATSVFSATSPPQIVAACCAIESFLNKHAPDQTRWFFSITFPTLICKIFGFDESSSAQKPHSNGWIDVVAQSNDSELASRVFNFLSPNGVLMSSILAIDMLSLVKYVFPIERLPEWVRYMLQNERDCSVLEDLCPLFKGRVKGDSINGSSFQVQLNVFEYYMFWFAYYPVCRGNSESRDTIRVRRSKKFRLENWAHSIPGFSSTRRGTEQKMECNLYIRLLYAYLRAFVPIYDLNSHQPYRSSLLHYSLGYDSSVLERAMFFVNTLIHYWSVDNDFSPLPMTICKSLGVTFPFRSVLSETPPTSGLGEVVNVFVKYLNLSLVASTDGSDQVEYTGSPSWRVSGPVVVVKPRDATSGYLGTLAVSSWNSSIQRPLYRYILRTFLFCPVQTSIKNESQVFSVWINYMEPWTISLEDFAQLDANVGLSTMNSTNEVSRSPSGGYSFSWQGFVLANYLFYSSLVMHFIGFAHKFLHTDAEVIVQMVSKVLNILTSSIELMDLMKNVDIIFHSQPPGSSKSMLNNLYKFVPSMREQLQDWEDGLCENDADGSFLHENWNKDLRLFSDSEDGGQQLLQLFVLRAESELQSMSGENVARNLQCLDALKGQLGCLFGSPIVKSMSSIQEREQCHQLRDEIFMPRRVGNPAVVDIKYKGDWMKRPISNDEVAWLAKLLVNLSGLLNESLGLNASDNSHVGPAWSYVKLSRDVSNVCGPTETMKVLLCSFGSWLATIGGATLMFMRKHGIRVNLRMLALKKAVTAFLIVIAFGVLKKAFAES